MNKNILLMGFALSLILALSFVNAQYYGFYGYNTPAQWLENELVIFGLLFTIFFATIYYSLGNVIKGSPIVPGIIAASLAFLISAGIQREWYFLQKPILFWALILGTLLVIATLLRALGLKVGGLAILVLLFSAVWGSWPFIEQGYGWKLRSYLPFGLTRFFDNTSIIGLGIFIIATISLILKQAGRNRGD